jgi:hypothetical protein
MHYSLKNYLTDLATGMFMAAGLAVIAAIPLGILGVVNLFKFITHSTLEVPWSTYGLTILVVPGSYLVAAMIGGTAAFVLRPIRRFLPGAMITGAIVSSAVYATVGISLAVFYEPVGAYFLEGSSRQETWAMIPELLPFVLPIGAFIGLYIWWRNRRLGHPKGAA